jgi:predicted DNA-binding transcriptional regulator AlpA
MKSVTPTPEPTIALEVVVYWDSDECGRDLIGVYSSRRAAKRAARSSAWRKIRSAFPSPLSPRATGEVWIGGRRHGWLTAEVDDVITSEPTIGQRLRAGEAVFV